jgi:malonate transporter and related proteins
MSLIILLLPDFILIFIGLLLSRITSWGRDFWSGLEKLIYYVLFPVLLFTSIARTQIDFTAAAPAIKTAVLTAVCGMVLGFLAKPIFKLEDKFFASGFQTAFRFNSYIGLAIMGRLHGEAGITAFGIVICLVVPLANLASVWALARNSKLNLARELAQNPLIIATISGILFSLSGLKLPEVALLLFNRIGAASLACGLIAVGAALQLKDGFKHLGPMVYWTSIKLLALPIIAYILGSTFGITGLYFDAVMLLAALPTATSAYILAVRMGGDGQIVAILITISTVTAMLTIPIWLHIARHGFSL